MMNIDAQLSGTIEDRVKSLAYSFWLAEGRPEGRAEAHWFKALDMVATEAKADTPAEASKRKAAIAAPKKAATRKKASK